MNNLIETILIITIAVAVNGAMLILFMIAALDILNQAMDRMGLPRVDDTTHPPPSYAPMPTDTTPTTYEMGTYVRGGGRWIDGSM